MLKFRHMVIAIALLLMMMASVAHSASQTLNFAWDASTSADVTGYNLYKATSPDGPWEKLNPAPIPGTEYTTEITEQIEASMYFVATAVDAIGNESEHSNTVSGMIDNIAPGAPSTMTITIQIKIGD